MGWMILLVVAIVAIYVGAHYLRKFANRKVDEYINKKGERENKEKGPVVEKLSDKYGHKEDDDASK